MRDFGYEKAVEKAAKIARDAVAMIIAAGLAEDAAEADSLIYEGGA